MSNLYKLTDSDGYTRRGESNECKWGPGVKHTASSPAPLGVKPTLCTENLMLITLLPLLITLLTPLLGK